MAVWHSEAADGVALEIEFDEDDRFAADDPAVVPWLDRDDLRRLAFDAAAIRVFDVNPPAGEEPDVRVHAVLGADERFHVDRPAEPWWVDHAFHARVTGTCRFQTNVSHVAPHDILEWPEQDVT
jgi:hypothetical protein